MFKIGDRAKIAYIYESCAHNNQIGTITWLHEYSCHPNRNLSITEKRTQGTITYDDGVSRSFSNTDKLIPVK